MLRQAPLSQPTAATRRILTRRASAAWHVPGQKCRHVRVWPPGKDLFLILQKLIGAAASVAAEGFDSRAFPMILRVSLRAPLALPNEVGGLTNDLLRVFIQLRHWLLLIRFGAP